MVSGLGSVPAAWLAIAGEVVRYGIAGASAVALLLLVLVALIELLDVPATPASAIAYACAVPVNYLLQRSFVFGAGGGRLTHAPRFLAVTGFTLGLNTLLFWVVVDGMGVPYALGQVVVICVVVPVSYLLNRHFTFAGARRGAGEPET